MQVSQEFSMEWRKYENCVAVISLNKEGKSAGEILQFLKKPKNHEIIYIKGDM